MTLFSLAKKNLKMNTKNYLLYFYPMVFSIVIYFTFVSLQYNNRIIQSASSLGKVQPAFLAASVLLLIFSAIFIWYSNSFFTRKRKKEVALYSLFGMRKKQIAKLLFFENLIMGFAALGVGIGIGILLSKLFAMVLIKLMGFSFLAEFEISASAVVQTLVVFVGIIGVTSYHNYRMIYRYSLIELLRADKQGDRIRRASKLGAILSIVLLGTGYYIMLQPSNSALYKEYGFTAFLMALLFVLIGTFLIMHSFFVSLLEWIMKFKELYFRGTNLISVSHLRFRMKGNVLILSVISLLSTITLFAIGTIFGFHQNLVSGATDLNPLSIMYTSQNKTTDEKVHKLIKGSKKHRIIFSDRIEYLQGQGDLSATGRWPDDFPLMLLSEKEYMRLAEKMGIEPDAINSENDAIVFNDGNLNQNKDQYTGKNILIADGGKVTIKKYEKYHLLNQSYSAFPIVISDRKYQQLKEQAEADVKQLQIYKLTNERSMEKLVTHIEDTVLKDRNYDEIWIYSSFYQEYQKGVQTYGLLIFIGAFLGIVFLLATGSMLYYKQLTEATADQGRYKVLKKIGMSRKQIKKAIAKQLLPVFLLPLVIAIPNSSMIISALASFAHLNMIMPFIGTIIIYMGIYSVYYFMTLRKYNSLVNQ